MSAFVREEDSRLFCLARAVLARKERLRPLFTAEIRKFCRNFKRKLELKVPADDVRSMPCGDCTLVVA